MFQPCFPHLFKHDNAQLGDSEKIFTPVPNLQKNKNKTERPAFPSK
jgi:hypothetical protein